MLYVDAVRVVVASLRYRSSLSDVQLSPTIIILISCIHGLNAVQASQAQRLKREREATRQMRLDKERERGARGEE